MGELASIDGGPTTKDDPTTKVPLLSGRAAEPAGGGAAPEAAREELLLVRPAWGAGDVSLEARLRETGLVVRPDVVCEPLLERVRIEPPAVIVLELEPFEPRLLEWARGVRQLLSQNCPAILAVMRRDDETLLEQALGAGVVDVMDPAAASATLRVEVLRFARKRAIDEARTIGGYSIARVLGRGGMGVVYAAERDGEPYAIKVLETGPNTDGEALARFRREMEALRTLEGPGIPRFLEAGRTTDCFFYVMELVQGPTLHELAYSGALDEPSLRRIASDIAGALRAIHRAGFVHRDVKPGNIIVSPEGRATLIDYGLTKLIEDDLALTKSDEVFGTLQYIAPEILEGVDASAASDAYALGMTLFHAAMGESPVDGSAALLTHRILVGDVPRPSERLHSRFSAPFVAVLEELLDRDPATRLSVADVGTRLVDDATTLRGDRDFPRGESAGRALELTLRIQTGTRAGQAVTFAGPRSITIGRATDCDVALLDVDVSRHHCTIVLDADGAHVKDLDSANGTHVNGIEVGLAAVSNGDHLRVADTELRVELAAVTPPTRRSAAGDVVRVAADGDAALHVRGYDLLRPIGAARGSVFEARSKATGEVVAIKLLRSRAALAPGSRERFLREARTASALVHPNVVAVLGHGEAACGPYLVMELVRGETLRSLVARTGPLAVPVAIGVARQIASALELARTLGVVHRDVKPENILVRADGVAKLADFGIARRPFAVGEDSLTGRGDVLGTVAYMAPEQLTDAASADHRADIYSLGATLHHALAGAAPFTGKTAVECFKRLLSEPPPCISAIRGDVPPVLLAVVSRCLAKDPADRFQSAGDLERLLATLLVAAADPRTTA